MTDDEAVWCELEAKRRTAWREMRRVCRALRGQTDRPGTLGARWNGMLTELLTERFAEWRTARAELEERGWKNGYRQRPARTRQAA